MKILFTGDLEGLREGISILAKEVSVNLAQGGYTFAVTHAPGARLAVSLNGKTGAIRYDARCHFFRAFGLAVEQIRAGNEQFALEETPQFRMNGPMFDVSQGGAAFNLPAAKHILRQLALMGLNMMMFYCEDSFEAQNQPYFGYMRPRYSECEMKELDDYAYALGIELIPCIQTLAHLPDPLRWKCYAPIKDYTECLLVGEEQTYAFIRDLLISASRPLRTKKIHVGLDEAGSLGRGKYMDKHGYRPPIELMREHLRRVMEIVNELGLEPMMWDDMFFRALLNGKYYKPGFVMPPEAIKAVPAGMHCIYWDYYHNNEEDYEAVIDQHLALDHELIFAGGCWTWVGFSLCWSKTLRTTEAALNVCKRHGVKDIIMTVWGDNGTECLANTTLVGCQLFAEHGYAETLNYEKLKRRFRFCTGGNIEDFEKLELLDRTPQNAELPDAAEYNASKYLMWQDILTGLCDQNIAGYALNAHYAGLSRALKGAAARNGQFNGMFEFSYHAARVLAMKSEMGLRLTAAYQAGDRGALRAIASKELPELKRRFTALRKVHMREWFKLYKPLGWDIMDMRYGSLLARIGSAIEEINAYLAGELPRIEELEIERLPYGGAEGPIKYLNYFGHIVSASRIAPKA